MYYKNIIVVLLIFLNSCVNYPIDKKIETKQRKNYFLNKGFALVYNDALYKKKLIKEKIENRSLIIFQRNLKENSTIKITNLINSKYIIAKVGKTTEYPFFYNSVISKRISQELEIDELEPYIEIKEIVANSSFVAKKAKTFDEEKKVSGKAPIDSISVYNLNDSVQKNEKKIKKSKFNYIIKIADFYFKNTAKSMIDRIKKETPANNVRIQNLSSTQYRVFLGPFNNINSLQKAFNDISTLEFENIEIIKNDKNN
jgi:hypothetical protein